MFNNFQREGSKSNADVGKEFEKVINEYFVDKKLNLDSDINIKIGINYKKQRSFDMGSFEDKILIECKSHTWTRPDYGIPNAKLKTWISEMYMFYLSPKEYRKIFVVQYDFSPRYNETLLQYFIRLNKHLIPDDVELMEYDIEKNIMYIRNISD